MKSKLIVSVVTALALSACAGSGGVYQNPVENLRTISINQVRGFAAETRTYLEQNGEEKTITAAQETAKRGLKDPDSAKFQNVRVKEFETGTVVCGELNGKNSYGAYVGYKPFAAGISGVSMYDTSSRYPEVNAAANAGIMLACGG